MMMLVGDGMLLLCMLVIGRFSWDLRQSLVHRIVHIVCKFVDLISKYHIVCVVF